VAEGDPTVSENQRLKKEVRELQARIAALESSRWWRLHPRFLLRRTRKARTDSVRAAVPTAPPDDGTTARFRAEVVEQGAFSEDWFTVHIPEWNGILAVRGARRQRARARLL